MTDAFSSSPSNDRPLHDVAHESSGVSPQASIDAIEADLADVETALARLDAGTYWTDEITGQPLSTELLGRRPLARRNETT